MDTPRIDSLVSDLCEEIDMWKNEADRYKKLYEDEKKKHNATTTQALNASKQMVGSLLSLALNSEQKDGHIIIKQNGS